MVCAFLKYWIETVNVSGFYRTTYWNPVFWTLFRLIFSFFFLFIHEHLFYIFFLVQFNLGIVIVFLFTFSIINYFSNIIFIAHKKWASYCRRCCDVPMQLVYFSLSFLFSFLFLSKKKRDIQFWILSFFYWNKMQRNGEYNNDVLFFIVFCSTRLEYKYLRTKMNSLFWIKENYYPIVFTKSVSDL